MNKLKAKEVQLENAISMLGEASNQVKYLSREVKKGLATPKQLQEAIDRVKRQGYELKIIHAEAKILSGYERITFSDVAPSSLKTSPLYILIGIFALAYLVMS